MSRSYNSDSENDEIVVITILPSIQLNLMIVILLSNRFIRIILEQIDRKIPLTHFMIFVYIIEIITYFPFLINYLYLFMRLNFFIINLYYKL